MLSDDTMPACGMSAERASDIIGLIYDCVIDPTRWQIAVDAIHAQLGTGNASLQVIDFVTGATYFSVSSGIAPEWGKVMLANDRRYRTGIVAAWGGDAQFLRFASDEPVLATEVASREEHERNLWIREWARPQGLVDCLALFSVTGNGVFAGMPCGIHESRPFQESMRSGLRLFAPHIRRAICISRLLEMKGLETSTFEAALDGFATGIVLVAEDLAILHANDAARDMLKDRDPVGDSGGRLRLPQAQTTAALADAVARAAVSGVLLGQRGIAIPARRRDGSPAVAHVMPLAREHRPSGLSQRAVAAVFVASSATPPQMPAAALALLYDLTPAETRTLELIVDGKAPAEIAAHLGISLNTVKTHMKRVFDKTGQYRQADLVRLVASLALPV